MRSFSVLEHIKSSELVFLPNRSEKLLHCKFGQNYKRSKYQNHNSEIINHILVNTKF